MTALSTALTLGTILLASEVSVLAQQSVEVEMFQRISAEFDKARSGQPSMRPVGRRPTGTARRQPG